MKNPCVKLVNSQNNNDAQVRDVGDWIYVVIEAAIPHLKYLHFFMMKMASTRKKPLDPTSGHLYLPRALFKESVINIYLPLEY